ncbi:MAG: AI-2E family transporter [Candidatus Accumulibacter sp.]|uniref:AI-2E family transporter n=1 Tax=Accumulibacter sp. TaxID=2053492 RepID=UPI0028789A85|nr:AI-2E family transporter [Accumulibacter sp.]MDS4014608.1 AI-2E family transporter [Accumulibacter sp.]
MNASSKQLIQIALVALLLIGCVAVLLPFTGTLLFAVVICIITLPIRNRLLTLCRGRSNLAALLISMLLLLLLVAPMALLSGSLADGIEMAIRYFKPLFEKGLPVEPPAWLGRIPVIGPNLADYWHELAASREEMNNLLQQFIEPTRRLALAAVALFAQGLLQLVLVIFFVFFIFRDAHIYVDALHTGSRMLAGDLGERMLALAEGTVTGVMVGIVGTAAAQAVVAMIGFIIAGVPGVVVLTFATFFFSMIPVVGATLIWLGAAVWLYNEGQAGWAVFIVLWGMFGISSVDNFLKPILISRTASLPLLLIVVGVLGGVLVFGFIGLFLGPTLLALGQVLIREWLAHAHASSSTASGGGGVSR